MVHFVDVFYSSKIDNVNRATLMDSMLS